MANEDKKPKLTDARITPPEEFRGTLDARATAAMESIAVSLARLADRFAPPKAALSVTALKYEQCARGHNMQPTDGYCQACWREDHPGPGPVAA